LDHRGANRATRLGPKKSYGGEIDDNDGYRTVIWHDKNPETLAFNPLIAGKTCGKCHPGIVAAFLKSSMGGARGAHTQSQYVYWTGPSGPQSCGLWLGRLKEPAHDSFTDENRAAFNGHSTREISRSQAYGLQRNCNQCHVGCLDCHYAPEKARDDNPALGQHTFVRVPQPLACYGGGRSFACHAGPLERRRGDGYLREELAQTTEEGKSLLGGASDVHAQKGIECVACHEPNRDSDFHGDLKRTVDCGKCHERETADHLKGVHRNVDCATCHSSLIGGYAFNFWTTSGPEGDENPVTRIQDYLVAPMPPLIVRNPKGHWIPVHVVPHVSGNVKPGEVTISRKLRFRNSPDVEIARRYLSNDSFAVTGLANGVDSRDKDVLVWLNVDRVAHGLGKPRACESCHASTVQKVLVNFSGGSYKDVENGRYVIVADGEGLRVTDFEGPDGEPVPEGLRSFTGRWGLPGDFALPGLRDAALYESMRGAVVDGRFKH
ncbi:MAG: cytochrome c3 family protein, partial [Thermodesulfobacteriota bacterium]